MSTSPAANSHALIAKVTVQRLLQQVQHAEILTHFGDTGEGAMAATLQQYFIEIRQQLHGLEHRLEALGRA